MESEINATNQIIAKISRGSNMNQIYLPKNASGIGMIPGQYVTIHILTDSIEKKETKTPFKPYFYGLKLIEPIKLQIIRDIFDISAKFIDKEKNLIITGSFLESGFNFKDVDIILLSKVNTKSIEQEIVAKLGIRPHLIVMTKEEFLRGLASDPLYQTMISRCISNKRLIFNYKPQVNAKLLDLHLLKSKSLIDNFEILNGKEKYYLTFNLISIFLFIQRGKITKELVEQTIKQIFSIKTI